MSGSKFATSFLQFEKHIPDLYTAELQLNKANTSEKETSFLDLNIKVIGSDIHTSIYTVSQEPQCARFSRIYTCSPIV